jgi:hypothetical protein
VSIPACGAVLNRASIRFGCNPPIETGLAIYELTCSADDKPASACATNTIVVDTAVGGDSLLLPQPYRSLLNDYSDSQCKWYPVSGLDLSDPKNPKLTEFRNKTYTLVASEPCQRLILHRIVRVPCALQLSEPQVVAVGSSYDISATVLNGSNTVEWNCFDSIAASGNTMTYNNVGPGTYYFSVFDPVSGCWDEKWVSTMQVSDNPNDCTANLAVSGGITPYTYLWSYKDQGGTPQWSAQPTLYLGDKTEVSVTVTDSQGNTAVFQPLRNCRTWPSSASWALAALILLGLYLLFRGRRANLAGIKK